MGKSFRIFVDTEQIYYGDFSEVPQKFRGDILEALDEWGEVLGKSGLNEMIYSLFTWYEKKDMFCAECNEVFEDRSDCVNCGIELVTRSRYSQNEKISGLLNCVGMITHLEIEK